MHFVFIACNKNKKLFRNDPSCIYRCENLSLGLKKNGHTVELVHIKDLNLFQKLDVAVFHRPSFSFRLWLITHILKLKSKILIADIDDFIFDETYADTSPAYINNILSENQVKKQFQKNLKALKLFDKFTTSTEPLKLNLKDIISSSNIKVIPNAIFNTWKNIDIKLNKKAPKIISYFPGTKSHDKDFKNISKPLSKFLNRYKDVKLKIVGPLNFTLDVEPKQIEHCQKVIFSDYWKSFEDVWVNIAPLEYSAFTECKSALKVLEAGYFNIPTIISKIPDAKRFINSGAILYENEDEFYNALVKLYDNTEYNIVTNELKRKVLNIADVHKISKDYFEFAIIDNEIVEARLRRKEGKYDLKTLNAYQRAWYKSNTADIFVEYCMFCRDLGYKLSKSRYKKLKTLSHKVGFKHQKRTKILLNEYNEKTSNNQKVLKNYIENKTICVVGNSAKLRDKKLGNEIDTYDIVIRFNNCCSNKSHQDLGNKTNIWVSSPDIKFTLEADLVIVSGPNMFKRSRNWKKLTNKKADIITVPLEIWKELVIKLKAPPSAGILILYWLKKLRSNFSQISITGFDLEPKTEIYHYADDNHKAGIRHNWISEKKLIQEWVNNGLYNLS